MYILTSMQQFPAQRRHKAFKKKEGCVCKRSPGREENSLLGKRRKEVYLRVKYCGPLKGTERGTQSRDKCFTDENTDEIKNNCNLIKVVNFIYIYMYFFLNFET